jgi:hypothetical protein
MRSKGYSMIMEPHDEHSNARTSPKIRLSGLGASTMRASHCGEFGRPGSILCSPSNGISILQRGSPWSGSAFYQRLHGAGLLVVKHRAEIAHIKPVFKEVKLDRGRPMASANENS